MVGRSPSSCEVASVSVPHSSAPSCSTRYAEAGCSRVHFWPIGEEERQLDLLAQRVLP